MPPVIVSDACQVPVDSSVVINWPSVVSTFAVAPDVPPVIVSPLVKLPATLVVSFNFEPVT